MAAAAGEERGGGARGVDLPKGKLFWRKDLPADGQGRRREKNFGKWGSSAPGSVWEGEMQRRRRRRFYEVENRK